MLTIQQNFATISLEELILWSCINGAKALNIDDSFGSFDKGKKPGVNLITGIDFKTMKLTPKAKVKRLIQPKFSPKYFQLFLQQYSEE
eukprot:TRINITY_DN118218_c0_g1_i1.p1 TRINITY_DN118218_c0_g1~~TRINITY_DN118218_c0_g1_i1.p1  ORF type:complete len:103 (+),score=7.77 TRINITY_DN118218_c0_g1_i1:46-309(+)